MRCGCLFNGRERRVCFSGVCVSGVHRRLALETLSLAKQFPRRDDSASALESAKFREKPSTGALSVAHTVALYGESAL